MAHAHNDYVHGKPLADALRAGFRSVEADVWLHRGEVVVSHHEWLDRNVRGSLVELYLRPLQDRVDRLRSVTR